MTRYLDLDEVIAIHAQTMERLGEVPRPLRDRGALESAVNRARMAAHYEGADLCRQAALLAVGISQAQAFVDGNKRTAQRTMRVFVWSNGFEFVGDPLDIAHQLERVAEHRSNREAADAAFERWLRDRLAPRQCAD